MNNQPPNQSGGSNLPQKGSIEYVRDINAPVQPIRRQVHHIDVMDTDTDSGAAGYGNLDAYMVSPYYLPPQTRAKIEPKRPLGQTKPTGRGTVQAAAAYMATARNKPVNFYTQAAVMSEPLRIRRPRRQLAVVDADEDNRMVREEPAYRSDTSGSTKAAPASPKQLRIEAVLIAGLGLLTGLFAVLRESLVSATDRIKNIGRRGHYSAARGASTRAAGVKKRGISAKFAAALVIFLLLISFGLFGGLINRTNEQPQPSPGPVPANQGTTSQDDTPGGNQHAGAPGNSESGGLAVDTNPEGTNSTNPPAVNPQPAGSNTNNQNVTGTALQPTQSMSNPGITPGALPVGGRGGPDDSASAGSGSLPLTTASGALNAQGTAGSGTSDTTATYEQLLGDSAAHGFLK